MRDTILVASEEYNKRSFLIETLRYAGYRVVEAETGVRCIEILRRHRDIMLAFISCNFTDLSISELVGQIRDFNRELAIVLLYQGDDSDQPLQQRISGALHVGADYFIKYEEKPLAVLQLTSLLSSYVFARSKIYHESWRVFWPKRLEDFVHESSLMKQCIKSALEAQQQDANVFITGERGSLRRALAATIARASDRYNGDFIELYPQLFDKDITEEVMRAIVAKAVVQAENGNLCLVDIDILKKTEIAVIASEINKHIETYKAEGIENKFRLFIISSNSAEHWKKNGQLREITSKRNFTEIEMPPLRKRREDIEQLAKYAIIRFNSEISVHKKVAGITGVAASMLAQYNWPGNVSELFEVIYHAMLISEGPLLMLKDFPTIYKSNNNEENSEEESLKNVFFTPDGEMKPLNDIENKVIKMAIEHYNGSISEVARRLKVGRSTLYRKIESWQKN